MARTIRSVLCSLALLVWLAFPAVAATPAAAPSPEAIAVASLAQLGIDPATAVIQKGTRNYAGPACPGAGWTCVGTDRPVVQISSGARAENEFQCTASEGVGTDPGTNTCVVVQVSAGGTNNAKCHMTDRDPIAMQTCSIAQESGTGNNHAQVHLRIEQHHEGDAQTAEQQADVSQSTGAKGKNEAHVFQTVGQSLSADDEDGADLSQSQETEQVVSVTQESEAGNNHSHVDQSLRQRADAEGEAGISQEQNASADGPDLQATIDQTSDTGKNDSKLRQGIDQDLDAESEPGPVEQTQGSFNGGSDGNVHQNSSGVSTNTNVQDERQTMDAETTGSLSQTQFGPQRCCSDQFDNSNNSFDIEQTSVQTAGPNANQINDIQGTCNTSGQCMVDQSVTQNGQTTTNSCTSQSCNIFIFCAEGECTPGEGGEGEGEIG